MPFPASLIANKETVVGGGQNMRISFLPHLKRLNQNVGVATKRTSTRKKSELHQFYECFSGFNQVTTNRSRTQCACPRRR